MIPARSGTVKHEVLVTLMSLSVQVNLATYGHRRRIGFLYCLLKDQRPLWGPTSLRKLYHALLSESSPNRSPVL